ncbi:AMP-binding protein [Desulfovibrio litoralis]|uniref:Long-chain-fatty-acid--[acyl-carrier-protein] ligase n=1 Tax=Desulfovibrio litoralis DSM 11393 TaxID=1121455 RepID=A0A1M7TMG9_9BACT|nr:AMP-binding protein [Desulfovibrio litoralis]SHN71961.1 long-chain-fatty-acid--[acyl-carrier-protein] ligase [Desulfovibrio litoralis DSM 11393]
MKKHKNNIYSSLLKYLLPLRYDLEIKGLDKIKTDSSILFLPNHPALIDPLIIYSQIGNLYPAVLADERQMKRPLLRRLVKKLNIITIADPLKDGISAKKSVEQGLDKLISTLEQGKNALIYPAGQINRSKQSSISGKSGVFKIIQALPNQRVVLIRTKGLWGSRFSYAYSGSAPKLNDWRFIMKILFMLIFNFLFFIPKRKVEIEFVEAYDLPRDTDKKTFNKYLENFYSLAEQKNTRIPDFFWQGNTPKILPEPKNQHKSDPNEQSLELITQVKTLIKKLYELPKDQELDLNSSLTKDLGLDSLSLLELSTALENEFGQAVLNLESLETVGDCVLAAAGLLNESEVIKEIPKAWFKSSKNTRLTIDPKAQNIPEAFITQVLNKPDLPLTVDRTTMKKREELLLAALILSKKFKQIKGKRVGVMLPAVPAVTPVWLALQLAGKTPVMLNWTVGEQNLNHCLKLAEVNTIISSERLIERLKRSGLNLNALPVKWLELEKLATTIKIKDKIFGFIKTKLIRYNLLKFNCNKVPNEAVILFTSGSETLPKAVPLTQENLMTNAKDLINILSVSESDRILAMLPPFHSFGFMVNVVLPLSSGLKVAFHPNPTEGGILNGLVKDYKLSILASAPSFLGNMLDKAKNKNNNETPLKSVRLAFMGAEKCPELLYKTFTELCPQATLCEGYGITECSPVVSVNTPENAIIGSIGETLPSVDVAIIKLETLDTGTLERVKSGETGMLLIKGKNIFNGYLGTQTNPFIFFEGKKWYKSGDLVTMDKNGHLFFKGRLKRFIKLGGEMISLPQIESILIEAYAKHQDAPEEGPVLAVESSGDETKPEIILFTPLTLNKTEVNEYLRNAGLSNLYSIQKIIQVETIPLLGTGKTNYRALKDLIKNTN